MKINGSIPKLPTRTELIIDTIKDNIISGSIPPGSRLTEEYLARELKTSRTPIREALIKLESQGYLYRRGAGGYIVIEIDLDNIIEKYELREMIEMHAILHSSESSKNKFLEKAEKILESMNKAVEKSNYSHYRELDTKFHLCLKQLSEYEHKNISEYYAESFNQIKWIRTITIAGKIDIQKSYQDHKNIFNEMAKGDLHGAVNALVKHYDRINQSVKTGLAKTAKK